MKTIPILTATILALWLLPPANAAVNDLFNNATVLTGTNAVGTGNNYLASLEPGEPYWMQRSLWWRWTAPSNGRLTLDTAGSSLNTALAVFVGPDLARIRAVTASDNTVTSTTARVSFQTIPGATYHICAGSPPPPIITWGDILLRLSFAPNGDPAPIIGEDNFNERGDLVGTQTVGLASTVFASTQTTEPPIGKGPSVWWTWVAPFTGRVVIDTAGSDFDTGLAVYTGDDIATLTPVRVNDDCLGERVSCVQFTAQAHRAYQIAVRAAEKSGSMAGNVVLNLYQNAGPDDDLHAYPAVEVELFARTGQSYQLQKSPNLVFWENVGEPFVGGDAFVKWLFPTRGFDREYYRARPINP